MSAVSWVLSERKLTDKPYDCNTFTLTEEIVPVFADLSNRGPVIIEMNLPDRTVYTGDNVTFECMVASALTPNFLWSFKRGSEPDHVLIGVSTRDFPLNPKTLVKLLGVLLITQCHSTEELDAPSDQRHYQ